MVAFLELLENFHIADLDLSIPGKRLKLRVLWSDLVCGYEVQTWG